MEPLQELYNNKEGNIMKLFDLINKSNNGILIVAKNKETAIKMALKMKFIKDEKNLKIKDITFFYQECHASRGYIIPKEEGQLYQDICGSKSKWGVIKI